MSNKTHIIYILLLVVTVVISFFACKHHNFSTQNSIAFKTAKLVSGNLKENYELYLLLESKEHEKARRLVRGFIQLDMAYIENFHKQFSSSEQSILLCNEANDIGKQIQPRIIDINCVNN